MKKISSIISNLYDTKYLNSYRNKLESYELARYEALKDVVSRLIEDKKKFTKILDYGCGNGLFVPLLKESFPYAEHYFSDISNVALKQLLIKYPEYKECVSLIDNDKTNYESNTFDFIISIEVMEHVDNLQAYLNEIYRLLKPNGYFIWTTPCANSCSIEHIYSLLTNKIEKGKDGCVRWKWEEPTHLRRLTSAQIEKFLFKIGFSKVDFKFRSHLFSFIFSKLMFYPFKIFSQKMMKLDYVLFKNFKNGASMIGYAKK